MIIKNIKKRIVFLFLLAISVPHLNPYSLAESTFNNNWTENATSMPVKLDYFSTASIGDKIYYIGGLDKNTNEVKSLIQIYDTNSNTWSTGSPMPIQKYHSKSIAYNNKIYCFGGLDINKNTLNTVDVYDTETNSWSTAEGMPENKFKMSLSIYNDKIYLAGGKIKEEPTPVYSNNINVFDPKSNKWTEDIPIPFDITSHASEVYNDKLYLFNGYDEADSNKVNIYDFKSKTWSKGASANVSRHAVSTIIHGNEVYVMGGRGNYQNKKDVEIYNLDTDSWSQGESSSTENHWGSAIKIKDRVYCLSGENTSGIMSYYSLQPLPKSSANIDIFIKPESILSVSLNTNSITFDNFNFIDGLELPNATELNVSSSLPYQVTASLSSEIQNQDGTTKLNPDVLSIKASNKDRYNTFNIVGQPLLILDNQTATDSTTIGIDLKINSNSSYQTDNYKGTIKLEVNQI